MLMASGSVLTTLAARKNEAVTLAWEPRKYSANDKVRVALIGTGIQGNSDLSTALKIPGVELAAACDLYTCRLERMKEVYGKNLFTTKDYREILNRKDVDAVIIATNDYWHAQIATDALKAGKHVYCEKPMVHKLSEGLPLIDTYKSAGKVMQIGSQGMAGIDYVKARDLYKAGEIGQLNCIEATYDRQSAIGAWEYTMPADGSPQTVDWDRYVAGMNPKPGYDAKKFFWWRNYKDFGTGMSGDLFVHLLTEIHYVTGSVGPQKIVSSGQLSSWKDGRDVPDVMTALMDYPETKEHPAFQLMLRVNFISGGGDRGSVRYIGSEGVLEKGWDGLKITHSLMPKAPGFGGYDAVFTYPQAMQDKLKAEYDKKWTAADGKIPTKPDIEYKLPDGYDSHVEHFGNFFAGIREGKQVVEDPVFGFRACAPCLAANDSYFQKKIVYWDPVNMKVVG